MTTQRQKNQRGLYTECGYKMSILFMEIVHETSRQHDTTDGVASFKLNKDC